MFLLSRRLEGSARIKPVTADPAEAAKRMVSGAVAQTIRSSLPE